MSSIDWFRKTFPGKSKQIPPSLILPKKDHEKFTLTFSELVGKHFNHITKLAEVFKELNAVNHFHEVYKKQTDAQIKKANDAHEKLYENELWFKFWMFEAELHMIGVGIDPFSLFVQKLLGAFTHKNDTSDIILFLIVKRIFNKMRKKEPEAFGQFIDYIKEEKEWREESQKECQLFYYDELIDNGLRGWVDDIQHGRKRESHGVCLSFNQMTQAKVLVRNIMLDYGHCDDYLRLLQCLHAMKAVNKDFEYGFGWLILHLNTLCEAKLRFFMDNYEEYKKAPKHHSLVKKQRALVALIKNIEHYGYLTTELKYMLNICSL